MSAETEAGVGSIPSSPTSVKHSKITMDLVIRIASLWEAHKKMDVECKMSIGDLMRSVTPSEEKHFKALVLRRLGKTLLQQFVGFAWVAGRWSDEAKRSEAMDKHKPWSWFRDNGPGGAPAPVRLGGAQVFQERRTTVDPAGDWCFQGVSRNEREGKILVSRERMEVLMRGEGWEKVKLRAN